MTGLLKWLKRPFPIGNRPVQNILISLLFGLFIFGFLAIFQPFTIQESESHYWLSSLGYGLITTVVMIINFLLLPLLFKGWFDPIRSNVGHALLTSLLNIASIAVANWVFYHFDPFQPEGSRSLLYFLGITLSVGLFPIVILLFWFERIYFIRYSARAENISGLINKDTQTINNTEIHIRGEGKTDTLLIQSSNLICIKSEGNYLFSARFSITW